MKTFREIFRSAITGEFVTRLFARRNPTTTVRERRKVEPKDRNGRVDV